MANISENKAVLLAGAAWFTIKFVSGYFLSFEETITVGVLTNLFIILTLSVIFIRRHVKNVPAAESNWIADVRAAARPVLKYAFLGGLLIGFYNYVIAKETLQLKEAEFRQGLHQQYANQEAYKKLQDENPTFQNLSAEEAEKRALENYEKFNSPYLQITMSLFALVISGLFYSTATALIWRKMMG
jgi:hypothetical protein